jgi:hypothetical protein
MSNNKKMVWPGSSVEHENRYHYCGSVVGQNATYSGIAQLTFRIVTQDDLERLKEIASTQLETITAILSLSYLGREFD